MRIPFVGLSYVDRSLSLDAQRTINFYPVKSEVEDSKAPTFLRATPGLLSGINLQSPTGLSGYDLDGATPVPPPPDAPIPCGGQFILDLTFPGPAANFPAVAYTFTQDVTFPCSGTSFAPYITNFVGSTATIEGSITQTAGFYLATSIPGTITGDGSGGILLQVSNTGVAPDFNIRHAGNPAIGTWFSDHYVGGTTTPASYTFFAGESLYLLDVGNDISQLHDMVLHLVGTAVCD